MEDRFDAEISLGHGAELVTELTDLVAAHPVRERLVAALMRALVATGRDTEALLVYERTRETLADELGVDPSPELSALHVALLRGELGRREENRNDQPACRADQLRRQGRRRRRGPRTHRRASAHHPDRAGRLGEDQAGHGDRAHAARRPAGRGLAGGARGHRRRRVTWRRRRSPRSALRDALLGEAPDAEPTDRVIAAVRERAMLLILDNCEHVIESAAAFAHRVLGECPRLRILATSREPLGITGEALWPVAPLVLPADDADPGEIESSPAVRAAAGPGRRGAHGPRDRRPHVVDDGAHLPGAGRDAAGDRARRGQVAHHVPRSARRIGSTTGSAC